MNPNALFLAGTDLLSEVLWSAGMRRLWRPPLDLRLVYYHGVGPGRAPCFRYLSDEVPRDDFAYHLDYLMNNYRMLSLRDAVDEMVKGKHSPKPICSISFDDGLSSVYTEALPLLRERNLPATVFLNTASVGNGYMTWLHLTSFLLSEFGVRRLAELFNKLKSDQLPAAPDTEAALLAWYKAHYEANFESDLLGNALAELELDMAEIAAEQSIYLNWENIEEMKTCGFSFSSHTKNHAPLGRFSASRHREAEIKDAFEVMRERGQDVDFVSLPFGMKTDYGDSAVSCALAAGHAFVLEVGNGVNYSDTALSSKVLARVALGAVQSKASRLYSAIEVRPLLKSKIKT